MAFSPTTASDSVVLVIDHNKIDANLTDFPVAIPLDDLCPDLITDLGANKLKMAVGSSSGTQYYVEIECWETGNHVIHTKIPSISSSADTEFTVFWDSSQDDNTSYVGVTNSTPAESVWDENFVAVYHMAQDPSGTSPQILDSTSNSNDGASQGTMTSGDLVDGYMGKAIDFDGVNDAINLSDNATYSVSSFTLEAFCNLVPNGTDVNGVISNYGTAKHYGIREQDGTAVFFYDDDSEWDQVASVSDIRNDWTYVAGVLTASTSAKIFVNGALENTDTSSIPSAISPNSTLYIGKDGTHDIRIKGAISEVRISNVARSDAWIKATNYSLTSELLSVIEESVVKKALIVSDGYIKQASSNDVIASAITDTNDKFVATTVDGAIDEIGENKDWNGFDLLTPDSMGEPNWDNATRVYSLAVKDGETEFVYWVDGKKQSSTETISADPLTDVSGTYYYYIDGDGALQFVLEDDVTVDVIYRFALVGLVYWNSTASYGKPFEERHGKSEASIDHEREHRTFGARYESGLSLTGLVDAQDTFTGATSGYYWDEDIRHFIALETTMPFLYRLGTDAEWTWSAADNKIGFFNGGTVATWNKFDGTTWGLEPADTAHDYILIFVTAMKTLDGYSNFSKLIDQAGYPSRSKVRDAIEAAKKKLILDGLPSPEMIFIGVYICRKNGDLENLADGSVYLDLRGSSSRSGGGDSFASNKAADSILDTANFTGCLSATDTDVQKAIESLMTAVNNTVQVPSS